MYICVSDSADMLKKLKHVLLPLVKWFQHLQKAQTRGIRSLHWAWNWNLLQDLKRQAWHLRWKRWISVPISAVVWLSQLVVKFIAFLKRMAWWEWSAKALVVCLAHPGRHIIWAKGEKWLLRYMFDWSESSLNHGHDFEDVPPQDVLMKYMTIAVFLNTCPCTWYTRLSCLIAFLARWGLWVGSLGFLW